MFFKMRSALSLLAICFLFIIVNCDNGELGGADVTNAYKQDDNIFNERMTFLDGIWSSGYDSYSLRKWSDIELKQTAKNLFPAMNADNPLTYASRLTPGNDDYVFVYDDGSGNASWGFGYVGMVRAINIFNGDINRGSIIIEYFEHTDPKWLTQGVDLGDGNGAPPQIDYPGEKPFFGIYYRVIDPNTVQIANAVDLAALYAGKKYYTEKGTLQEAINYNCVENESELINWGVVIPQQREK